MIGIDSVHAGSPNELREAKTPASDVGLLPYEGATFALLTQHGKEQVIGQLFAERWNARVQLVTSFDTDSLGTFTRNVPRDGSQLAAARKKACIAMEHSGLPFGIGSEGSFGASAFALYSMNLELVLLRDAGRGIEIVGRARAPGRHWHATFTTWQELENSAERFGFPEHGLVLRPVDESDPRLRKGVCSWESLNEAFAQAQAQSSTGVVFVENDLRAHVNPTRMANILAATADLIVRMHTRCARCDSPGFGFAESLPGLRCRGCGQPTQVARAERFECVACKHEEVQDLSDHDADPSRCDFCNP
jgi:hypothetical protein